MKTYMTYSARISAIRKCRFCLRDSLIQVEEPIIDTPTMISLAMAEVIEGEAVSRGWKDGACPTCAHDNAKQLHAEHHADNAREMMEVGS